MNIDINSEFSVLLSKVIGYFTRIIDDITDSSLQFNEIKSLINYIYNIKNWSILRLDENTNQLFFTILQSETGETLKQIPIKVGKGICGEVASTGKPQILTNIDDEKNDFTKSIDGITGFKTQSIIAVPIKYSNKILGVFELINVEKPELYVSNPNYLLLMQMVADFIGVIFSLSHIHQQIIFSSERDALTGVHNRLFLNKMLNNNNKNIHRLKDKDCEVIIAMIDLNNFKNVNDNFGHFVGDLVLKETARLLSSHFRKEDIIIRYGGDEFLLLIQIDEDKNNIIKLVHSKLQKISADLPYNCSLSFGISLGQMGTFDEILSQADKLMYFDKSIKKKHGKLVTTQKR